MLNFASRVVLAVAVATLLAPSSVAAQQNVPPQVQQVPPAVESAARRFGLGIKGGVGFDPELLVVGAHATFGPLFAPTVQFRPGLEIGVGEVTTFLGINLDVLYTFPRDAGWRFYAGAGPNFGFSHVRFEAESDDGNRFDFSDTDGVAGINFIGGARADNGLFIEVKASAKGVTNVTLLAGFNF